jgi:DNA-binding transcriptional LysR family regulator
MNQLDAMRTFMRVAELGSFAAVANQLGTVRSVVTRQVAALEEHLGVKLMVRSTRSLTLTSAGAAYLDKCRAILDMVDAAEAELMEERATPRGKLRVSLPLSYGLKRLAPLMLAFSQLYPEIQLAMDFTDRRINLIEEGVDLSVRVTGRLEPGDIVRKLGTSQLLALASPGYLALRGRPQHPSELMRHACIGYAPTAAAARGFSWWMGGSRALRCRSGCRPTTATCSPRPPPRAWASRSSPTSSPPTTWQRAGWRRCSTPSPRRPWASMRCSPATATCPTCGC